MNIQKLLKLKGRILQEPNHFDMKYWTNDCGTGGCIAGMSCHMEGYKLSIFSSMVTPPMGGSKVFTHEEARKILGLTPEQSRRLFYVKYLHPQTTYHWPSKFAWDYKRAKTPRGRALATARRIDHFIQTDGRE